MSSISLAFTAAAFVSGISLVAVAGDSTMYNHLPRNRWKWLLGLMIATATLSFTAVLTNGKDCNDFTESDYRYGNVPISCHQAHPNSEMEK